MELDPADVATAAAALLGHVVTEVSWRAEPVDPDLRIHSATEGVVRVVGMADGERFSLVVKAIRRGFDPDPGALWVSGLEPAHRNYWKREWLAYSTGLLAGLPGRLRAARCLHATEPSHTSAWIWLEDVAGRPGRDWDDTDYERAAHDLGTTQGAYATGAAALPDADWLAHEWLRGWVETTARFADVVADDSAWRDERVAPLRPLRSPVEALWAAREELLAVSEAAPATIAHYDFWPANLVAGDDGRTVAIDWSQVGVGNLAQDLDQLTLDPVWMQVRPDGDLDALERHVLAGYLAGLHDAGLTVSASEVRRCYAAAAAVRYAFLTGAQAEALGRPDEVVAREARWRRPYADLMADRARVVERAVSLGHEVLGG